MVENRAPYVIRTLRGLAAPEAAARCAPHASHGSFEPAVHRMGPALPRPPLRLLSPQRELFDTLVRYPPRRCEARRSSRRAAAALIHATGLARAERIAAAGQRIFDPQDEA